MISLKQQDSPIEIPSQKNKLPNNSYIYLTISTCKDNPHDLYDYSKQQDQYGNKNLMAGNNEVETMVPKCISDYIRFTSIENQKKKDKFITKQYEFSLKIQNFYIVRNNKKNQSFVDFRPIQIITKDRQNIKSEIIAKVTAKPNFATRKIQFTFYPSKQQNETMIKNLEIKKKKISNICEPGIVVNEEKSSQNKPKGYQLKTGSIVCFGRVKYYVREIMRYGKLETSKDNIGIEIYKNQAKIGKAVGDEEEKLPQIKNQEQKQSDDEQDEQTEQREQQIESPELSKQKTGEQPMSPKKEQIKQVQQQQIICRICYDGQSYKNPLINLCKCIGSCKYTHIQCLKHWINNKVKINNRLYCTSVEKINCQICKTQIPMNLIINGDCEHIVLVQRPKQTNYIMLEKLDNEKKNILVIKNIPPEGVSIGRDSSCYIKIQQISVSRFHANINYDYSTEKFMVFDQNSRYGTIVIEDPLKIAVGKKSRSVQIGRTLLNFVIKKKEKRLIDEIC